MTTTEGKLQTCSSQKLVKLGPMLPWLSSLRSEKIIRSFYASVLHLKNVSNTSYFSPLEYRVKINLQKSWKTVELSYEIQVSQDRLSGKNDKT